MQYKYKTTRFKLESGEYLPELEISYTTYGVRKQDDSNIIWICHALTANADATDWWNGVVSENGVFNPRDYFIVTANILGSTYGTTGPLSINPETNKPYFHSFPAFTIRDMVNAHDVLRKHLNIQQIHALVGGSMGGQQALEWAVKEPLLAKNLILLATNAKSSPWSIAFRESQRLAIETDITWKENREDAGAEGLKTARSIALLSYRSYDSYAISQSETDKDKKDDFRVAAYQRYQGVKLAARFNAYSYHAITKAMDSHNIARDREFSVEQLLRSILSKTLVVGITSDVLFPVSEQKFLARNIREAEYTEIDSLYGHDGFLVEVDKLNQIIGDHLAKSTYQTIATHGNN